MITLISDARFNTLPAPKLQFLSPELRALHERAKLAIRTDSGLDGQVLQSTRFTNGIIVPAQDKQGRDFIKIWIPKSGKDRGDGEKIWGIYPVTSLNFVDGEDGWIVSTKDATKTLNLGEKLTA